MKTKTAIATSVVFIAVPLAITLFLSGCATAPQPAKAGKLYHVGLVWLKEPGNTEHRQKIIEAAHSLAREIPEVEIPLGREDAAGDELRARRLIRHLLCHAA